MKKIKPDYGNENSINLKLVIAISRTQTAFTRRLQNYLNSFGLTIAQFGVLEALYHIGPMSIGALIEKNLSSSGNMTVVIRNLEKEGLIERCVHATDRRAFVIKLTKEGECLIKTAFEGHLEILESYFGALEGEEKNELQLLLKKLNGIQ